MSLNKLMKSQNIEQVFYEVKWHNYLRDWRKLRDKERAKDEFHASTLTKKGFCLVKVVLDEMTDDREQVFTPRTLSIFMTGIDIHNKHQEFYKKTEMAYLVEGRFYSEFLDIFLTPDAIIDFMNMTVIAEIKSMNTFQFKKLKESPLNAYWQALVYMYAIGIPRAIIVIEDKNDQLVKVYKIDFDLEKAMILISRRLDIIKCLKDNVIPLSKRICKMPKQRKKCKYKDICFDREQLKEVLKKNKE